MEKVCVLYLMCKNQALVEAINISICPNVNLRSLVKSYIFCTQRSLAWNEIKIFHFIFCIFNNTFWKYLLFSGIMCSGVLNFVRIHIFLSVRSHILWSRTFLSELIYAQKIGHCWSLSGQVFHYGRRNLFHTFDRSICGV